MNRETDVIVIDTLRQVPTIDQIKSIPRERTLTLVFNEEVHNQREIVGRHLKQKLLDFSIGIHTIEPEINISKLIAYSEIEDHQDFFEQCAKEYRQLGEELLFKLVDALDLKLNTDFPLVTFNGLKSGKHIKGKMDDWTYFVHGFHCGFKNDTTGQDIEVPLIFSLEFGVLDPYFFSRYIKSTPEYHPLPVEIFEDFADGCRINDKMVLLGKFERISSNVRNQYGVVVADREKVAIKSHDELKKQFENQDVKIKNKQGKSSSTDPKRSNVKSRP